MILYGLSKIWKLEKLGGGGGGGPSGGVGGWLVFAEPINISKGEPKIHLILY